MDNLTHSLVGWALAETGLKRRSRKGLAACVLAANMPDIDVFFGWSSWEPLSTHRGFTHGLVGGVLLLPPLLAGLLWLIDRWQLRRGKAFPSTTSMHFGWLLALCYFGALTHPLLDLQNTYAVQLLSPVSSRWFHTDGLFIISPWLLAMLGSGIWLARKWGKVGPAITALAGAVVFVVLNIGISALARTAVTRTLPADSSDRVFASPEPFAFWRRNVIWRHDGVIGFGWYDPTVSISNLIGSDERVPDRMANPIVRSAAGDTAEVRKFLAWSQLPVATIRRRDCSAVVTFGDARFSGPALSRNFNVSAVVRDPRCRGPR
jgi:inner membrane protein